MNVYLVQHAESKPKEEDPDRPLSEKGLRDIARISAYAAQHLGIKVNVIYHSGKLRARQTAEAISKYLGPPAGIEETDGLDPLADPSIWANRVNHSQEDLMLVGHLPHLSKLTSTLICGAPESKVIHFQYAAIINLTRDEDGKWAVGWMITPAMV